MSPELKNTPLYEQHRKLAAKMVNFHGWHMPLSYSGIIKEHLATRNGLGLFDVSHMGKFLASGPEALSFLQTVTSNNVEKLAIGKVQYSLLLNQQGGVIDDLTLGRIGPDKYYLTVNAATTITDFALLKKQAEAFTVELTDISASQALIALQGAKSALLVDRLLKCDCQSLKYYQLKQVDSPWGNIVISRLGYTGEDGFELLIAANQAAGLWEKMIDQADNYSLLPAGLGARDTLRLEAGYLLNGQDMTPQTNPFAAGLSWVIKMKKANFTGQAALAKTRSD